MQKKLIALAVASLVSGGAFAQSSSVTIFGIIDVAIESGKYSDAAGNLTRMVSGANNTNRIGFRGTEALGNGMNANFLLEAQPVPENGTTAAATQFWNRSSTVGLSSKSWGSVNLGRQYTPWFNVTAANDVFWVAGAGSSYTLQAGDTRMNNSVRYDSVNMNGFTFAAMWGIGQDADGTGVEGTTAATKNLGREIGLNVRYANGPLSLNLGWDDQRTAVGPDVNTKRTQLNGAYDFKVVKVGLGYNTNKNGSTLDDRVWTITALMPVFGKDTLKAGYTRLNDKTTSNKDVRLIAIGYEHPMSKRTNVYATYALLNNDSGASKGTLGAGVAVAAGFDPRVLQMGIRHSF